MKKIFIVLLLVLSYTFSFSQYKGKKFIFDLYGEGKLCTLLGERIGEDVEVMPKGGVFTVERVLADGSIVISFLSSWKKTENQEKYSYRLATKTVKNANGALETTTEKVQKFFLIDKAEFDRSCSEFQRGNITFGTMITPFKFRFKPSLFETNLNLGACVAFQFRAKHLSIGGIGGLSLSSVTLDEYSTDSLGLQGTDRPAVTPSLHLMAGYKNICLTVGIGWDLINKKSALEKKWLYNGKTWFGVGIGVNLFTSNADKTAPAN